MNTSPAPQNNSPFAARASTRPPMSAGAGPAPAPATAAEPGRGPAGPTRNGFGKLVAAAAVVLMAAGAGVWWFTGRAVPERVTAAPGMPAPAGRPVKSGETPAARVARLAAEVAVIQARVAGLESDDAARAKLAEAALIATQAQARADAGDAEGAAREWERALAVAGPIVVAGVNASYEAEAAALREVRLEDQASPAVQALVRAREAAELAAGRGEWAKAIAHRDEARGLLVAARKAVAAQLAEVAKGAASRADAAMATLFHERALRLDAGLAASRDHLYRHKFKAGQIIRTAGGLELAYAPPAEFTRGSRQDEPGRDADETAQRVALTKGFFLAVSETTQRDWDRVMGAGAAARTLRAARAKAETIGPDMPMHSVTWEQAAEYCRRLSASEGLAFRLPTEAEWEYACRAGTTSAFNLGVDGLSARDANIDDGSAGVPSGPRAPGASGRANAWGLRDMHGNVWEWCADWSAPYPAAELLRDPRGPERESLGRIDLAMRVVRGGGWNAPAKDARSANRWEYAPDVATAYIGLRVAHDPDLARP